MTLDIYLASPNSQLQADAVRGMNVLLSYASYDPWLDNYQHAFSKVLIDSGAYSAFTTGTAIDIARYADWMQRWDNRAEAVAGLDDISGDWRKSMSNYRYGGFPTFHDTDPPELLDELIPMARERGGWLGIGLKPPRGGKEAFLRDALERIPADIHIHGWALRAYRRMRGFGSMDSTNWWRDGLKYRTYMPWLTYGECLEIVVKREQREHLVFDEVVEQMVLI